MSIRIVIAATLATAVVSVQVQAVELKVLGQPVGSGLIQQQKEQPFFESLAEKTGLDVTVEYRPVDVTGIPDTDGLRVLKSSPVFLAEAMRCGYRMRMEAGPGS